MNKATVTTPDGQAIEVDIASIKMPDGFQVLAPDQAPAGYVKQDVMNASIESRLARQKSSLKSDPEFVAEVLKAQGVPLTDDGKINMPKPGKEVDIDALRSQITTELVQPLKGELDRYKTTNASLLDAKRRSEIMSAAIKYGVREDLLKPVAPTPNAPTFWENMVAGQYGFNEEHGVFAVRDGEGFAYNPNGTRENPYLDIDAHMAGLKKDAQYAGFFKVEGQKGSGFSQNGGSASAANHITREAFGTGQISGDQLEKIAKGEVRVV